MTGSENRLDVHGFAELTLCADDPDRLAAFYIDVFALRRLTVDDDRIWLAAGGEARLGIWSPGVKEFGDRGGAHVHFAFSVGQGALEAICERARALAVATDGPVEHAGGDRSLYLTDPEGNRIEAWDYYVLRDRRRRRRRSRSSVALEPSISRAPTAGEGNERARPRRAASPGSVAPTVPVLHEGARMATARSTRSAGVSLTKGPVGILGILAIVFGILAFVSGGNSFALHAPHGFVGDGHFLGLLTNAWTDLLFVAAGLLLVIGSPLHRGAKTAALLAAGVLGAAAIIAVIRGNGVFGIFAADHRTEIVWGVGAVLLAVFSLLPRVGGGRERRAERRTRSSRPRQRPVMTTDGDASLTAAGASDGVSDRGDPLSAPRGTDAVAPLSTPRGAEGGASVTREPH